MIFEFAQKSSRNFRNTSNYAFHWRFLLFIIVAAISLSHAVSAQKISTQEDVVEAIADLVSGGHAEQVQVISINPISIRKRRSARPQDVLRISINPFGKKIKLRLKKNTHMLAENFRLSPDLIQEDGYKLFNPECFYHGSVVNDNSSRVAVSICDGVRGYVETSDSSIILYPLPSSNVFTNVSNPHIVAKVHNQYDSQRITAEDGFDRVMVISNNEEKSGKHKTEEKYATATKMVDLPAVTRRVSSQRWSTSRNKKTAVVETAMFLDESLYEYFHKLFSHDAKKELITYALTVMNQVQVAYEDSSLRGLVNVAFVYLEILYPQPQDKIPSNDNYDYYLTSFCIFQHARRKTKESDFADWDFGVMVSANNMFVMNGKKKFHDVVGLTAVSGMCNQLHSCALINGKDLRSAYIIAHEMGHGLGMEHDDGADGCQANQHIMSKTTGPDKTTWSHCSVKSLSTFLYSDRADCLYRRSTERDLLSDHKSKFYKKYPGAAFTGDQQCKLKYGPNYRKDLSQNEESVCRLLRCEKNDAKPREPYKIGYHVLEGTPCGANKWCINRKCEDKPFDEIIDDLENGITHNGKAKPTSPPVEIVPYWEAWSNYTPCSSGCTTRDGSQPIGVQISTRKCLNRRDRRLLHPSQCGGPNTRAEICDASHICRNEKILSDVLNQTCTNAAKTNSHYTSSGTQFPYDEERFACRIWCKTLKGSYEFVDKVPDGTECFRQGEAQNGYCVRGECLRFDCNGKSILKTRPPTSLEKTCIAPKPKSKEIILTSTTTTAKPVDVTTISAPRKACRHSCIRNGKGIPNDLSCTDCGLESMTLCDNSSKCPKILELDEYATNVCEKYRRRFQLLFSGYGIQRGYDHESDEMSAMDNQCVIACQDRTNNETYYQLDTVSDGQFPAGTPCYADKQSRGYCLYGKCIDINQWEAKVQRTQQGMETQQSTHTVSHQRRRSRRRRNANSTSRRESLRFIYLSHMILNL